MEDREFSDLSVVMISRNEELAIGKVVRDLIDELPGVEVIVVDGSDDKTPEIARNCGALVLSEPGGGYGPALNMAVNASGRKFVATVDADDTYNPKNIKELILLLDRGFDIAGGSRISRGKPHAMPLLNYLANLFFSALASLAVGQKLKDIHSGMRAYRSDIFQTIKWTNPDLGFTVELLLYPVSNRSKTIEIPIDYRERIGKSQLVKLASAKATVVSIWRAALLRYFRISPSNVTTVT